MAIHHKAIAISFEVSETDANNLISAGVLEKFLKSLKIETTIATETVVYKRITKRSK